MEHLKDKAYWINHIWQGHALEILQQMPDETVDMCITSPPYFGLRDYKTEPQIWGGDPQCVHQWEETVTEVSSGMIGMNERLQKEIDNKDSKFVEGAFNKPKTSKSAFCTVCKAWKGELGLEPYFDLYVEHLAMVFDEVKRVLKPSGSCYVNVGDTYGGACSRASEGGRAGFGEPRETVVNRGYDKCLLMVPERFAIAMIDRGWILRNKIIWFKPNAMPSSVDDRLKNTWEYIFFFVKNKKYYYDLNAIREEPKTLVEVPQSQVGDEESTQLDLIQCQVENKPQEDISISLSPKYEEDEGHSNRQGLNRQLDTITLKAYREYQQPIARFLKRHIKKYHEVALNQAFGEHKWRHWIRTDLSGAALPGVDDWAKLKEILQFNDTFDDKIYEVQKLNIPVFSSGKNPGDFIKKPYAVQERDKEFVEYRNLPPLSVVARFLNHWRKERGLTIEEIEQKMNSQAPHHWFNSESYPTVDDWLRIKEILDFGDFWDDHMTTVYIKSSEKQNHPLGSNPGDVFEISTQPFPESHFAVFPEELCIKPIQASCPEFVCNKCGQPRVKIYEKGQPIEEWKKDCGADSQGEYKGQGQKEYEENKVQNPSDVKRRVLEGMRERILTGYIQCECNAEFEPGIVMDIFAGAGTSCLVANKLGRYYVGIELSPKYIKIAERRIDKEGSILFKGGYYAEAGKE